MVFEESRTMNTVQNLLQWNISGRAGEYLACHLLEGIAFRVTTKFGYDVYWADQGRRVEVKSVHIQSSDIGKKILHVDLRRNWKKHDYVIILVYIDDVFDHSYLIGASQITNRKSGSKSITIPKNWDNFNFRSCLYTYMLGNQIKYVNEPYSPFQISTRKDLSNINMSIFNNP